MYIAHPLPRLPRENLRDYVNEIRQDLKFRALPFRLYYHLRARKYRRGRFKELGLLPYLVPAGRNAVDVGANLGLVTYYLARLSDRVFAYEPNPYPFRTLKHLIDDNVELYPWAISDQSGQVTLSIARHRRGWSSNGARIGKVSAESHLDVTVEAHRLDDLPLKDIGFVKIDVEGHEQAVLAGAQALLARDRPNVMVELEHSRRGQGLLDTLAFMKDLGYSGYYLQGGVLRDLARFSCEACQIAPRQPGGDRRLYVKDFVFLA